MVFITGEQAWQTALVDAFTLDADWRDGVSVDQA